MPAVPVTQSQYMALTRRAPKPATTAPAPVATPRRTRWRGQPTTTPQRTPMTTPTLAYRIAHRITHNPTGYAAAVRAMDIAKRAAWVAVLATGATYLAMLALREVVGVVFDFMGW